MKKRYIPIFLMLLLITAACDKKTQQQTENQFSTDSLPSTRPEDVVAVSNQSEFLRTIVGNTTNQFFRDLNLGDAVSDIKAKEKFEIFEDSTNHVSYTHETESLESVDVKYNLDKNRAIHDIKIDVYLNTKPSTNSLWDQFDNYFSGRYIATKTAGKAKVWKARDGVFIKLMDISEGKDFGLQIKMGPDAANNLQ